MDMTLTVTESDNESKNIHFSIMADNGSNAGISDNVISGVKGLSNVDKVYEMYGAQIFSSVIDKNSEIKEIQDLNRIYQRVNIEGKDKTFMKSSIIPYDSISLDTAKGYIQSGTVDETALNRENGVIVINKNMVYNQKTKNNYFGPIADLKVGDTIELVKGEPSEENKIKLQGGQTAAKKVKVLAILKNDAFDNQGAEDGIKLITTTEVAQKLADGGSVKPVCINISLKDVKKEEESKKEIEAAASIDPGMKVINNIDNNRKEKSTILMLEILVYGFVIVVSLIGCVNIINTITTNIILRRREFAALKSIGLTQGGLKKMITLEGLLYGIMGTIFGSIIGSGLSYVMFKGMMTVRELRWGIPWNAVIIAGTAALAISYLAILAPLSRIKKENLIEVIREDY